MAEAAFDCVIRGGRVATAVDEFDADVGIKDGTIAAIGRNLPAGASEIDARGQLVLPGGIDAHAHIEQLSAAGIVNADTFESATDGGRVRRHHHGHLVCRPASSA